MRIFAGDQPGTLAMEGGTLDVLRSGAIPDVARFKADSSYNVMVHPSSGTFYEMAFLTSVKPFDNKLVRQAFNWAIDRQRNAESGLPGLRPAGQPAVEPQLARLRCGQEQDVHLRPGQGEVAAAAGGRLGS